ncbi:unannotated protein [freshwater metagenome]|uniref:Unannotated protein n=1 Tax=freshwater metagenome TaxID=449393 RepID=A0A6J7BRZ8_9ZZZZ
MRNSTVAFDRYTEPPGAAVTVPVNVTDAVVAFAFAVAQNWEPVKPTVAARLVIVTVASAELART